MRIAMPLRVEMLIHSCSRYKIALPGREKMSDERTILEMNDLFVRLNLLAHVASTVFMVGLIWFVQVVHYQLMGVIGKTEFSAYEQRHTSLTTWVVGPPMLVEGATALLLFSFRPSGVPIWLLCAGIILLAIIWLSTFFLQVPCHETLFLGFDAVVHRRLVLTNWIRTVAWNLRGMLALWVVWVSWGVN